MHGQIQPVLAKIFEQFKKTAVPVVNSMVSQTVVSVPLPVG